MASPTLTPDELALATCDREPIHIPQSIQPHGGLMALAPPDFRVVQASRNVGEMLGIGGPVVGRGVGEVLGDEVARAIVGRADDPSLDRNPATIDHARVVEPGGRRSFEAIVHRSGGLLVVELEPRPLDDPAASRDLYASVRSLLSRIEAEPTVEAVCRCASAEIRRITGVDRVLVYRFDEGWDGTVVAEDRNDALPSYLGLTFPASDIPAQARALYRANRLRLIPDAGYRPVPIDPAENPLTGEPIDLSFSTLRSVSPIHVEYMNNMGTGSSMSISILVGGELWGLISCHNREPLAVPFEVRSACDFLGQVIALQIDARAQRSEFDHRLGRKALHSKLLDAMSQAEDFVSALADRAGVLMELVQARGAAIVFGDQVIRLGACPAGSAIESIVEWLVREPRGDVYGTDSLAGVMPEAEAIKDTASGLLAASISQVHRGYILWFRPEVLQTLEWGGDPRKNAPSPEDGRIHPRKSFEAWKQIVSLHAARWRPSEVEAAVELRNAILGVVLRRAEERAELSAELERSNKELEAFSYSVSHDLRAPFRHIVGYSELLREDDDSKLSPEGKRYLDTIVESAQYAGLLVDNLLAFSRMGRSALNAVPVDMDGVVREVIHELQADTEGRSVEWRVGDLPEVEGDLMMIHLVLANLASNAVKYTKNVENAVIAIDCEPRGDEHVFRVSDNGVGFDMQYADKLFGVFQRLHRADEFEGIGIGLANVRRIVSRHGGRTWGEGVPGRGATFSFTLPRRSAWAAPTGPADREPS